MRAFDLSNIQIQDLEIFLAAVRYGSFTKAGEKLFVTQSWVSKRIGYMERELDIQLFRRNSRRLQLTPAGRVLAERLENITTDIRDAVSAAYYAQAGTIGSLKIGMLEWGANAFMSKLKTYIDAHPQLSVDIFCQQFDALRASLEQGRLDVILNIAYDNESLLHSDYDILTIDTAQMMVYMSSKHYLAGRENIDIRDIRAERMLMVDPGASSGYNAFVMQLFREEHIKPIISQYAANGREHLGNLILNRGILIASEHFLGNEYTDLITKVPLRDVTTRITAVWKRDNKNPTIMLLLNQLMETR